LLVEIRIVVSYRKVLVTLNYRLPAHWFAMAYLEFLKKEQLDLLLNLQLIRPTYQFSVNFSELFKR